LNKPWLNDTYNVKFHLSFRTDIEIGNIVKKKVKNNTQPSII